MSNSSTPRSSSRSKRSTTNLSNLRLAPLSTKFAEAPREYNAAKSPYEDAADSTFARSHPSYLQGKSAPTTPGILSRSSSRRHIGGGLSRRGSLYENEPAGMNYEYAAVSRVASGSVRVDVGSGQIPKAKSEAALLVQQRLSGQGVPLKKRQHARSKTGGTNTPRARSKAKTAEDDWLTRTGAATNALLQESKGQSWLTSRQSSTSLTVPDSDDDEDDQYEEMAALSASTARIQLPSGEPSPVSIRHGKWGSRFGSRSVSRRTSRRGSATGSRTPLAGIVSQDVIAGYFDNESLAIPAEPDFVDAEDEIDGHDEAEVARLTKDRSYGLGGIVDRLMGFNMFSVPEHEETTDTEGERENETETEAQQRREAEAKRKRDEKDKLVAPQAPRSAGEGGGQAEGGWQDAAWLLSVASRAMF